MFKNILVAVDLEHGTHIDNLLRITSDIANTHGVRVHLLNVVADADSSARFGNVYQEILAYADKIGINLNIVASHKPNVGDDLLGTTAARIVRHATCSVLVIRQNG